MAGKLYGVGVGPGDPELLTLKAVKIIKACDVIAVPGKSPEDTNAYRIACLACPQIKEKELLGIYMPMTKDEAKLERSHEEGVLRLEEMLNQGKDVAFLTLGDPCIYSTCLYLYERILKKGYEAELVNGVPSFCAAAARAQTGLGKKEGQIHIIPASCRIEEALKLPGTKIFMKAGKQLGEIKERLKHTNAQATMVENCGMPGEKICHGAEDIPESAGYYTLIFVKEEEMP